MELHLLLTIVASFLALLGLLMDLQSLLGGLKRIVKGTGAPPLLYWPLLVYALAALAWDTTWSLKGIALLAGLAVHFISTVGVRVLPARTRRN